MRFVRNISVKYLTDQSGITGLETAIVLIAFVVVVVSVLAFFLVNRKTNYRKSIGKK